MQNSNYRDTWALSQSCLKDFSFKPPIKWKKLWIDRIQEVRNNDVFALGSLTDTILFTPNLVEERFVIMEEVLPSPTIATILKQVYERVIAHNEQVRAILGPYPEMLTIKTFDLETLKEEILREADDVLMDKEKNKRGWNAHWKPETRIATVIKDGTDYFASLVKAAGRQIISLEMNMEALLEIKLLKNDPITKAYFTEQPGEELWFQMEIFTEYELSSGLGSLPIKGALDIVRVSHKDKTVQVCDFKSSYSAFDFIKSIKQLGYCFQLSFYDYLIRDWLSKDEKYKEYRVLEPCNIVIDKETKVPYIYEYDWKDIAMYADGNADYLFHLFQTLDHNARVRKGWKEIIEDIGWHYFNNKWDKPRELYENNKVKVNLLNT